MIGKQGFCSDFPYPPYRTNQKTPPEMILIGKLYVELPTSLRPIHSILTKHLHTSCCLDKLVLDWGHGPRFQRSQRHRPSNISVTTTIWKGLECANQIKLFIPPYNQQFWVFDNKNILCPYSFTTALEDISWWVFKISPNSFYSYKWKGLLPVFHDQLQTR